jgi:hypothetical protein
MTVYHVPTRCPRPATLREEIWPNGTEVQDQLFGIQEQFHQTTMFITRQDCPPENAEEEENRYHN